MNNMSQSGRHEERALSLLEDGNSPESVARVLGMSVADLTRLQESNEGSCGASNNLSHSLRSAKTAPLSFDSELAYQERLSTRFAFFSGGIFLILATAWFWHWTGTRPGGRQSAGFLAMLSFATSLIGAWFMLRLRFRFALGRRGVSVQETVSSAKLDYSEIAAFDCKREVQHGRGGPFPGHRLVFLPKNESGSKLSVFIPDDEPLPNAMVERLRHLSEALGMAGFPL